MSNTTLRIATVRPAWLVMASKEIRENAVWAGIGLVVTSLLAFIQGWNEWNGGAPIPAADMFWNEIRKALALGSSLLGMALGILQILPEQKRDLWAFLTHRPANRNLLFCGKVTGGLFLITTAALAPFLVALAWASVRHHVAGEIVIGSLRGLAGIPAGFPFYFAGMLMALPPARWLGSRALALPAAIFLALAMENSFYVSFWPGASVMLGTATLMAMAARAAFVSVGRVDGSATHPKAEFVANVAVLLGVVALCSGVASWFAVPIFIAIVVLAQRPYTVPCPSCGRKRSLGSDMCPHCRSPFPGPPTDGTEIFAAPVPSIRLQVLNDEALPSVKKEVTP